MLIRIDVQTKKVTCEYIKNGAWKHLPKVGAVDPDDGVIIVPEPHTGDACQSRL